jgi:hypothetical protein
MVELLVVLLVGCSLIFCVYESTFSPLFCCDENDRLKAMFPALALCISKR